MKVFVTQTFERQQELDLPEETARNPKALADVVATLDWTDAHLEWLSTVVMDEYDNELADYT